MLRNLLIATFVVCLPLFAQDYARHPLYFYDASQNLEYVCSAASEGHGTATWAIADSTLTSIVDTVNTATVTTAAAHGLTPGDAIVIAGVTTDEDLNGTATVLTTATATTLTIASADVTDATYTDATETVAYTGPRTTAEIWSIQKYFYDASGNLVKTAFAVGTPVTPGRAARNLACASRATYEYR